MTPIDLNVVFLSAGLLVASGSLTRPDLFLGWPSKGKWIFNGSLKNDKCHKFLDETWKIIGNSMQLVLDESTGDTQKSICSKSFPDFRISISSHQFDYSVINCIYRLIDRIYLSTRSINRLTNGINRLINGINWLINVCMFVCLFAKNRTRNRKRLDSPEFRPSR